MVLAQEEDRCYVVLLKPSLRWKSFGFKGGNVGEAIIRTVPGGQGLLSKPQVGCHNLGHLGGKGLSTLKAIGFLFIDLNGS